MPQVLQYHFQNSEGHFGSGFSSGHRNRSLSSMLIIPTRCPILSIVRFSTMSLASGDDRQYISGYPEITTVTRFSSSLTSMRIPSSCSNGRRWCRFMFSPPGAIQGSILSICRIRGVFRNEDSYHSRSANFRYSITIPRKHSSLTKSFSMRITSCNMNRHIFHKVGGYVKSPKKFK